MICAMTVSRLTVHLMVLSPLLIAGCIIPVEHAEYSTGKEIRDEDLAFIELGVTTKSEIVERLGEPHNFVEEQNVFTYLWTNKTLFIVATPIGAGDGDRITNDAVCVQFDSNDHVKRFKQIRGKKHLIRCQEEFPNGE